jgi:hypothetical protein
MGVVPQPEIAGCDAPLARNRCRLGEDERSAADRPRSQMHQVPIVGQPLEARILAHGRQNDAAAKLDAANTDRRQQTNRGWDDGCG